jgi:hypothetical protein
MGVGIPVYSKPSKMAFKNFKKIDFFACTYYLHSYSCQFSGKNKIVYDLHENNKYANDTVMIRFALFKEIQISIFSLYIM